MPISKQSVHAATAQATVDLGPAGSLNIVFRPAMLTEDLIREMEATAKTALMVPMLVDWDFYDQEPVLDGDRVVVDPGVKMPINEDSVKALGITNAMLIFKAMVNRQLDTVGFTSGGSQQK